MKITRTAATKNITLDMERFRAFLIAEQFTEEFCDQLHLFLLHDPSVGIVGQEPQALEPSITYNGNESFVYIERLNDPLHVTRAVLVAVRQTCHDYMEWTPALDSLERWMLPLDVEGDEDCQAFASEHAHAQDFVRIERLTLEKDEQDRRHRDYAPFTHDGLPTLIPLGQVFVLMSITYLIGRVIGQWQGRQR